MAINMAIFLETKRLIIKKPVADDFNDCYGLQRDPEVMKYIGSGIRQEPEVKTQLDKLIQHQEKYGFSLGSVFEKDTGAYVGRAGLIYLALDDTQPDIEVGYALHKKYWEKGYATELAQALVKWGFQHLKVDKLVGVIRPKNDKSRRVLEKIGMHYVGRTLYRDIEVAKYEIFKNNIKYDDIKLIACSKQDFTIVKNMSQYYSYDICSYMSHEKGWALEENGLYKNIKSLPLYWEEEDRYPFIVRVKDELAGFVLINKICSFPDADWNMGEFFIMRKFQRKGVGKHAAYECFKQFPGVWTIEVIPGNEGAYRFWRSIISHYTKNNFQEYTLPVPHKDIRNIFRFSTR